MKRQDISKQQQQQQRTLRPMSDGPTRRPESVRLPALAAAVLLGVICGALTPLRGLDDRLNAGALGLLAKQAPARHTAMLRLSAKQATAAGCSAEVAELLGRGKARGGVLIWPATTMCPLSGASAGPPLAALPRAAVRSLGSEVVGLEATAPGLEQLGVRPARWLRMSPPAMVPSVAMADLQANRLGADVLADRVVVVALTDESAADATAAALLSSAEPGSPLYPAAVAAALDSTIAGDGYGPAPWWLAGLLGGLLAALVAVAYRARRRRALALGGAAVLLLVCSLAAAPLLRADLLPLGSLLGGTLLALLVLVAVTSRYARRWVGRANELAERAPLLAAQGLDDLDDAEFFRRVHSLAEQCFPASFVLLAELPPGGWHLQFFSFGEAREGVVQEQRRDVRQSPYCDEQGAHTPHVIPPGFLVMKDLPVVAVPLKGPSDLEGFAFFCGDQAEAAHQANPDLADRIGRELGRLLRHRRLAKAARELQQAGVEIGGGLPPTAALARTAEAFVEEIELLGAVLREAPASVLYADSFGDVRLVSEAGAECLAEDFGVTLPAAPSGSLIPPGSLSLAQVLKEVTGFDSERVAAWLTQLMEKPGGSSLEVESAASTTQLRLRARALRRQVDGAEVITGYVATLAPAAEQLANVAPISVIGASRDVLAVFPLAEAAADVARAAARSAGRPVQSAAVRSSVHAIAHRGTLLRALEAFLIDAATMGSKPVVSVREKDNRAELVIMDLNLGLPAQLLERAIIAPIAPPKGLESLSALSQAVYDSHGEVTVSSGGLGVQLAVRLLPANPVLVQSSSDNQNMRSLENSSRRRGAGSISAA